MSSARTNLRVAFAACIKEITEAAGYNFTYRHVYDPPLNMEKMSEYPSVNLLWGQERRTNDHLTGNNPLLDLSITLTCDVFISEYNDPMLSVDKVIADFQKYFGSNFYVQASGGERTAFNCLYLSATPWGTEVERPSCGVSIEFEIWYSIRLTNPETFA